MGAWVSFVFKTGWKIVERAVASIRRPKPWHVGLAETMQVQGIENMYPLQAKHKELFDPAQVDRWFLPGFLEAISGWRLSGDAKSLDIESLPNLKVEAPGIVSFDCLTSEFCDLLLSEVDHYQSSGLPQRAPNSMNNYGLVLNEIGLRSTFDAVLHRVLLGISALLFGDDSVRLGQLHGIMLQTENWGGCTLDDHHTFIVRYRPDEDTHLDMHIDDCDVTFNFGLSDCSAFGGSDLAFCGMYGQGDHRKHVHMYKHVKGRCVVHSGKRRHGALRITHGVRSSLIVWCKSGSFRSTGDYQMKSGRRARKEQSLPDVVCLSETHDWDYDYMSSKLKGFDQQDSANPDVQYPPVTVHGKAFLPIPSRRG